MNCYFRQRWRDERLQFAEEVGVLSLSTRMLERLWKKHGFVLSSFCVFNVVFVLKYLLK